MNEPPSLNLTPAPAPATPNRPALHHAPQAAAYGCAYHALYALTGRRAWLMELFTHDLSPQRFAAHAAHHEVILVPLFADNMRPERTTDAQWWRSARDAVRAHGEPARLFAGYGTEHPAFAHAVALHLPPTGEVITISDSARDELLEMPFAAFTRSDYAHAQRVMLMLPSAYATDYPPVPAAAAYAEHGIDPARRPTPKE